MTDRKQKAVTVSGRNFVIARNVDFGIPFLHHNEVYVRVRPFSLGSERYNAVCVGRDDLAYVWNDLVELVGITARPLDAEAN